MKPLLPVLLLATSLWLGNAPADPLPNQQSTAPTMNQTPKITPFLWFDHDAEEAIRFYLSIFDDAKILSETRWPEGGPMPQGSLMSARFQLAGQEFMALNGGPRYRFNEAVSLFVSCKTQQEIDTIWARLGKGGEPGRCGWLKDKFGLSWQVVPTALGDMLGDKDPARARRVAEAMMGMDKLDLARLQKAYDHR